MSAYLEVRQEGKPVLRLEIPDGREAVLGRGQDADCRVEGDQHLSRKHATLRIEGGRLGVKRLPAAANPILCQGRENESFSVEPGGQFVIGTTRFSFLAAEEAKHTPQSGPAPQLQHTMSEVELYQGAANTDRLRLMDLMELPEILSDKPPGEAYVHLAGLLRLATGAAWACVARPDGRILAQDAAQDGGQGFAMSRALITAALASVPRPTFYCWSAPDSGSLHATLQAGLDWAICAAITLPSEDPLIFYVTGSGEAGGEATAHHKENSRFVGLVAGMVGRSLTVQRLEGMQGRLQQYFSGPVISKILKSNDPKELEPRLAQATTMFFDLRGFSKRTEGHNEKILAYLGELRRVMTAMTEEIFKENGVVLQYLGDGIMACWNVPITDAEHVNRACRAALGMAEKLKEIGGGWGCGIGIHSGEVVAGSLGSEQMFSYTVMGSTVNQTSRVEGITKIVETPILVTHEVASRVGPGVARTRRVGRYQPAGMRTALALFELLPANTSEEPIATFEQGLDAFERGEWESAYEILDRLGTGDRPARYIKSLAEMFRRRPPRDWTGVIELTEK